MEMNPAAWTLSGSVLHDGHLCELREEICRFCSQVAGKPVVN